MVSPSAAVVMLIGTRVNKAVPSRSNTSCCFTCRKIYRSPGGAPIGPASPLPVRRMRVPLSTPGGISTSSVCTWSSSGPRRHNRMAWFFEHVAATVAVGAWPLDNEQALLRANLAVAVAQIAAARGSARFCAGAGAGFAWHGHFDFDLRIDLPSKASSRLISIS